MKMRKGFVTNSSTSNYVVIGVRGSEDELSQLFGIDVDDLYEEFEDGGVLEAIDGAHGRIEFVGKVLARWSNDNVEALSFGEDFEKLKAEFEEVRKAIEDRVGKDVAIGLYAFSYFG